MDGKAGAQISRRAFLQSAGILLALMLVAGVLTRLVPA
ncbi:MAG: twin-arginine translocation signal domain-containing protein, partial [Chloroflexi bacterium]|nr:twin-arginine translocation signal domain-containing protein [Chloroflexota bacterium]